MNDSTAHGAAASRFPLDRWWVAGFAWELADKPLARTLLERPLVLFRTPGGAVAALEDRCCHKELPLSLGTLEARGIRCGYHGLLFDGAGACLEIPGQDHIPAKACVRSYPLLERDQILWLWIGSTPESRPQDDPPAYPFHADPVYRFGGGVFHYDAPYQLIHDNLLDLSHLGYVHLKTIGGNARAHMNARVETSSAGETVRVVRHLPDSEPPPTYIAAWPFEGRIDRWQEVEFQPSHCRIWTGAMEAGRGRLDDPAREGFHMRGFHGVTPETAGSAHYFWTIATNPHPDKTDVTQLVVDQTEATFAEDKVVIEAQWRNQQRFPGRSQVAIHVDAGPMRARRVIESLLRAPA
ncbi:MAG: Rieske 2Fe-2S domain-containing protein [Burkholderiales bacterium]|nr:Rieske 2Fe-2S domain-containing protein [Burkholderiales bacterium]